VWPVEVRKTAKEHLLDERRGEKRGEGRPHGLVAEDGKGEEPSERFRTSETFGRSRSRGEGRKKGRREISLCLACSFWGRKDEGGKRDIRGRRTPGRDPAIKTVIAYRNKEEDNTACYPS